MSNIYRDIAQILVLIVTNIVRRYKVEGHVEFKENKTSILNEKLFTYFQYVHLQQIIGILVE